MSQYIELRGYWNYASFENPHQDLDVDTSIVTLNDQFFILLAMKRIQNIVRARLGKTVARKMHFGTSIATGASDNHFLYRRGRRDRWTRLDY